MPHSKRGSSHFDDVMGGFGEFGFGGFDPLDNQPEENINPALLNALRSGMGNFNCGNPDCLIHGSASQNAETLGWKEATSRIMQRGIEAVQVDAGLAVHRGVGNQIIAELKLLADAKKESYDELLAGRLGELFTQLQVSQERDQVLRAACQKYISLLMAARNEYDAILQHAAEMDHEMGRMPGCYVYYGLVRKAFKYVTGGMKHKPEFPTEFSRPEMVERRYSILIGSLTRRGIEQIPVEVMAAAIGGVGEIEELLDQYLSSIAQSQAIPVVGAEETTSASTQPEDLAEQSVESASVGGNEEPVFEFAEAKSADTQELAEESLSQPLDQPLTVPNPEEDILELEESSGAAAAA